MANLPDSADMLREQHYDARKLSYASTFDNPLHASTIRMIEWCSGKLSLLRMVRRFEQMGPARGQAFWAQALEVMRIQVNVPTDAIKRLRASGPLIIVANHPHGLVDGMVLAEIVGRVRQDYKILTRSLLTDVDEVREFMLPVPFQHSKNARKENLEMRRAALAHLESGGVIILFPSGVVAASDSFWGAAVEGIWNPFTAKLIRRSGAAVLPIRFPGQNSRAYQIANRISPILRQGLLLHEVVRSCGKPQSPIIGAEIPTKKIAEQAKDPRGFMAWLREHTLNLA